MLRTKEFKVNAVPSGNSFSLFDKLPNKIRIRTKTKFSIIYDILNPRINELIKFVKYFIIIKV